MINNLGIFSNNLIQRALVLRAGSNPYKRAPTYRRATPVASGLQIGGIGNDTINIGTGIIGPPGPPGPPGTPGLVPVTVVTTSPFIATLTDYLIDVNVAAPSSVILPFSPTGTVFVVKDASGAASVNPITVTATGALIDGAASATINTDYGSITLIFNGTEWNIV